MQERTGSNGPPPNRVRVYFLPAKHTTLAGHSRDRDLSVRPHHEAMKSAVCPNVSSVAFARSLYLAFLKPSKQLSLHTRARISFYVVVVSVCACHVVRDALGSAHAATNCFFAPESDYLQPYSTLSLYFPPCAYAFHLGRPSVVRFDRSEGDGDYLATLDFHHFSADDGRARVCVW